MVDIKVPTGQVSMFQPTKYIIVTQQDVARADPTLILYGLAHNSILCDVAYKSH